MEIASKTLADSVRDLYTHYQALQSSPHTVQRLKVALRLFLDYLSEHHRITVANELTMEHIRAFQAHLSQRRTKRGGLPLKPATINTILKGVRVFLDMLLENGHVHRPLSKYLPDVKMPHLLPKSVLNHGQVRQLLRRIDTATPTGIRDRAAIELLYSSGIRVGELEMLTLTDVDLDHGVTRVIGKGKRERFVPIGRTALKWLTSYIRAVRPFCGGRSSTDRLFLTEQGDPMPQNVVRQRVREYATALSADFPITPHTFRRSCTSEMIKSNANLYHVKQLLGHKSFETLNHYARLDITDLQKTHARCHPRERDDTT